MKTKYINKINSLFDGRKDEKYNVNGDNPRIAQFENQDIGCFFLSPLGLEDTVELQHLTIYDTNQGYGTKLLHLLCNEADKYQITLWIWPLPDKKSKKVIPLDKLKSWYNKFGFAQGNETFMIRKPNKN